MGPKKKHKPCTDQEVHSEPEASTSATQKAQHNTRTFLSSTQHAVTYHDPDHLSANLKQVESQWIRQELSRDQVWQRLLTNCRQANLRSRREILGNGNCFFAAVSDQLSRLQLPNQDDRELRKSIVDFLHKNTELQGPDGIIDLRSKTLAKSWHEYCEGMAQDGEWADAVVLVAMAHMLGRDIMVVTSSPQAEETPLVWIVGKAECEDEPILLGHVWEKHYISLEPVPRSAPSASMPQSKRQSNMMSHSTGRQPYIIELLQVKCALSAKTPATTQLEDSSATRYIPMTKAHEDLLRKHEVYITTHLTQPGLEMILSILFSSWVITDAERNYILTERTHQSQVKELLRTLKRKPDRAFQVFVEALMKTRNVIIADVLRCTQENASSNKCVSSAKKQTFDALKLGQASTSAMLWTKSTAFLDVVWVQVAKSALRTAVDLAFYILCNYSDSIQGNMELFLDGPRVIGAEKPYFDVKATSPLLRHLKAGNETITSQDYKDNHMLEALYMQWKNGAGWDVTLFVQEQEFKVHRQLFAACSNFLDTTFEKYKDENHFVICKADARAFKTLVQFLYTAELQLNSMNIQELLEFLETAAYLEVTEALTACNGPLEKLVTPESCVDLANAATRHGLASRHRIMEFMVLNSRLIIEDQDTSRLSLPLLKEMLCDDRLEAQSEFDIFNWVIRWLRFDATQTQYAREVLNLIRYELMLPSTIAQVLRHPIIQEQDCNSIQQKLKTIQVCSTTSSNLRKSTRHRCTSCLLLVGGVEPSLTIPGTTMVTDKIYGIPLGLHAAPNIFQTRQVISCLPEERFNCQVVVISDTLYVVGGVNKLRIDMKSPWSFQTQTGSWKKLQPMKTFRKRFSLTAFRGNIVAIGGVDDDHQCIADCEMYDIKNDTWSDFPPLPCCLNRHASCELDDELYVCGGLIGLNESEGIQRGIWSYNKTRNSWRTRAPLGAGRYGHTMVQCKNKLYILGGRLDDSLRKSPKSVFMKNTNTSMENLTPIECYDPRLNQWTILSVALTSDDVSNISTAAVTSDNEVYVINNGLCNWSGEPYKEHSDDSPIFRSIKMPNCNVTVCMLGTRKVHNFLWQ